MGSLPLLHWQFNLLCFKIIFSVSSSGERWHSLRERVAEVRHWVFRGRAFLMLLIHKAPRISQLCFRGSHHLPGCGALSCSVVFCCASGRQNLTMLHCSYIFHMVCNAITLLPAQVRDVPVDAWLCHKGPLHPNVTLTLGGPAGHVSFDLFHLMGKIYPVSFPVLLSTEK